MNPIELLLLKQLSLTNYLVLFVINGIKDTFNNKYIEELVQGNNGIKVYEKFDIKFLKKISLLLLNQ